MFQNANFSGLRSGPHWGAYSAPPDPVADGEGARCSLPKNPTPALGPKSRPFGPRFYRSQGL